MNDQTTATSSTSRYGITVPFDGVTLAEHRSWYRQLVELGYTDVWSAETDGTDGLTPLALAAAWEPQLKLGVAIIPAYTRGPALLAQSAASMAEAAPGRFHFGLGTSSDVIVTRWNNAEFVEPYRRVRDTIRFLRTALAGEKVDHEYDTFTVRGACLRRPDVAVAEGGDLLDQLTLLGQWRAVIGNGDAETAHGPHPTEHTSNRPGRQRPGWRRRPLPFVL